MKNTSFPDGRAKTAGKFVVLYPDSDTISVGARLQNIKLPVTSIV